jgi:excisionase family DNA binding protein
VNGRYLVTENVAELLGCSTRTIGERARLGQIPHRRVGGTRRLLFLPDELAAWIDGAELESIETANGGRVVRPIRPPS